MVTLGDKLVDKRIVERNLEKGLLTREQYEQYLAELADREASCERVEIDAGDSFESSPLE